MEPSTQTVDIGQTAKFKCIYSGYPIKTLRWYKNGETITPIGRISLAVNESQLVIGQLQRSDMGMYQCLVSNDEDNGQGSAQLFSGGWIYFN